ncbi:hypothetical protein ACFXHA_25800 [Nocardia sp. NPDC059240]|uniref:hypothetical protein n=1 Tax=Nocardia sp. NPDC059240 TaxID=3346786 RepID=UPI003691A576
MSARRAICAAALIGAAAFTAAAPAAAAPVPLESPTAASTEPVAGGLCNMDPLIGIWCFLAGPSA